MSNPAVNMFAEMKRGKMDPGLQEHLQKVYTTMGFCLLVCALGARMEMTGVMHGTLVTTLIELALLLTILFSPPDPEIQPMRFIMLLVFAFLTGVHTGPLLRMAVKLDSSLIMTAFLGASCIFIAFSLCAFLTDNRLWLAIGGFIFSAILISMGMLIAAICFNSVALLEMTIQLLLFVTCLCVIYDTQLIAERYRQGHDDYILHTILLFIDFVDIFRQLLMLLIISKARGNEQ